MALSKTSLRDRIMNALLALPFPLPNGEISTYGEMLPNGNDEKVRNFCTVFADSIIDEILENAVTKVEMLNHVHSGVTTGGGTSGPPIPGTVEEGTIE